MGDSLEIGNEQKQIEHRQKREYMKQSRDYKKLFHAKFFNRKETILHRSVTKNIEQLKRDRDTKKAQIWVAKSANNERRDGCDMRSIECHIKCQENLLFENRKIKQEIQLLERQNLRVDKHIAALNKKTVPDNQHQAHVAKTRKAYDILENQLEVNVKRECTWTAENAEMRENIIRLLNHRGIFNNNWTKMIQELNSGKKYLTDLVEICAASLESCTETYEKLEALHKREKRDKELRKLEIQEADRTDVQNAAKNEFLTIKAKKRDMADLEPREYKRRDIFRADQKRLLTLFEQVLKNTLNFSNTTSVNEVLDNFERQEGLYYSYFNYTNEMGYYMTMLQKAIQQLFSSISSMRSSNVGRFEKQMNAIEASDLTLKNEQIKTKLKENEKAEKDKHLEHLLKGIYTMFETSRCNKAPLKQLLGNHESITIFNARKFLKILETQLNDMIARAYVSQRRERRAHAKFVVRDVVKNLELPTDVNDIVIETQCPECAEGEDVNPYDAEYVEPMNSDLIKGKYREKIIQPEMQYRLHGLPSCRLPRSRALTNRR